MIISLSLYTLPLSLSLYIYIYIYTHICAYIYIYIYTYIHIYRALLSFNVGPNNGVHIISTLKYKSAIFGGGAGVAANSRSHNVSFDTELLRVSAG